MRVWVTGRDVLGQSRSGVLGGEGESFDGEYSRGHGEVPFSFWRDVVEYLESPVLLNDE